MEVLTKPHSSSKKRRRYRKSTWDHSSILASFPNTTSTSTIHECFMDLALEQAATAGSEHNEVPIGAVIVQYLSQLSSTADKLYFEIRATSHNQVETYQDASAHAEMQSLRKASSYPSYHTSINSNTASSTSLENTKVQGNWRLFPNATLYSTLEPCPMCFSAIQAFRIQTVVYGAPDVRLGACESYLNLAKLMEENKHPYHPTGGAVVFGGIRSQECSDIIKQFFRERRKEIKLQKKLNRQQESKLKDNDNNNENGSDGRSKLGSNTRLIWGRIKTRIKESLT